jgi:hypothetical protein
MPTLQWDPKVDLGNILTAAGFILTAATVLFAAITLRASVRVRRAEYLLKLTERYFKDAEVRKSYYKVDWGDWRLEGSIGSGGNEERWLDSLLYSFDSFDEIGHVLRLGVLNESDARLFAFQASRVLQNEHVSNYLKMLDDDYRKEGLSEAHSGARYLVSRCIKSNRSKSV